MITVPISSAWFFPRKGDILISEDGVRRTVTSVSRFETTLRYTRQDNSIGYSWSWKGLQAAHPSWVVSIPYCPKETL